MRSKKSFINKCMNDTNVKELYMYIPITDLIKEWNQEAQV